MEMLSGKSCLQNAMAPCMPIFDLQSSRSSPLLTAMPSFSPSRCQWSRLANFSSSRICPAAGAVVGRVAGCVVIAMNNSSVSSMSSARGRHLVGQPEQRADVRTELYRLAGFDGQLGRERPLRVDLFESAIVRDVGRAELPHPGG